jgi:CRP-like cAMP-binding protein
MGDEPNGPSAIDDAVRTLVEGGRVVLAPAGRELVDLEAANKLIALDSGISCLCTYTDAGSRRITAFHFPGEFCNLHRYISPGVEGDPRIAALTDCSFRVLASEQLQEEVTANRTLRLVLLSAILREIRIARQWLLNSPRPAVERVAHLLCELFDRQQASGVASAAIPLTQVDLADATGLSPVHINRTIQELRSIRVMTGNHHLEVADRKRLGEICGFDGSYLTPVPPPTTGRGLPR